MAEFATYSGNGGYSSSYSNLSPLAPPFTVDRSNPRPTAALIVGPAEPSFNSLLNSTANNWIDSSRKDGYMPLDSVLHSNVHPFHGNDYFSGATVNMPSLDSVATASTAAFSYGPNMVASRTDFAEAAAYYPSNLSPLICTTSAHVATSGEPFCNQKSSVHQTMQFDGFWEGSTWDPFQGGGFSKEMNAAAPSVLDGRISSGGRMLKFKGLPDETSLGVHMLAKEAQPGAGGRGKVDTDYFLGEHPSNISFVKKSIPGPFSMHPGTSSAEPSAKAVKSKGNQVTCSSPYEKGVTQKHAMAVSSTFSAVSSSSVLLGKPPVAGASCSTSDTVSLGSVNHVFIANDTGSSVDNQSNVKEHSQISSHGRKDCFNPSLVSMQLQKNDPVCSEFPAIGNREPSNHEISCNDSFDHLFGVNSVPFDPCVLGPVLEDCEASMHIEKPLDILDHYTPSVDSPCWKGSLGSHFSPFGTGEAVVRHTKDLGTCGSNIQGPEAELGSNALKISPEDPCKILVSCENEIPGNGSMLSLNRTVISDFQLGETESHDARETMSGMMNRSCSNGRLKDVNEPTKGCALSDKPVDEPNKSINKSDLKPCETVQQSFQGTMPASDRLHQLETSVADASVTNMSSLHIGQSPYLPFPLGAPPMNSLSCDKKPGAKNHIHRLIDTMYNLSDLLLFYSSKEDHELEERYLEALANVTDNLRRCMSKNFGLASFLRELQEGTSVDGQQTAASGVMEQRQLSELQGKVNYSPSKGKECSTSPCFKADSGMKTKDDKIIQAIKLVLTDNFHNKEDHPQVTLYKNLWLEAEAALCASNCTARYNRMKFELEKCKSESSRGEKKVPSAESDAKFQTGAEDGPSSACISFQNSPSVRTGKNLDDVMASFHILRSQGDSINHTEARDVDEVLSSKSLPHSNNADISSPTEEKDAHARDPLIQDSPILNAASQVNDMEASVMDRFHILKNRAEGSSSMLSEGKPPSQVSCLELFEEKEDLHGNTSIENDGESAPALRIIAANNTRNKLGLKDFNVNSYTAIQRPGASRFGNNPSPGWFDSSSSDWEHVLSEEL